MVLGGLTATLAVVVLVFSGISALFRLADTDLVGPTNAALSVLPASILSVVAGLWLLPAGNAAGTDRASE